MLLAIRIGERRKPGRNAFARASMVPRIIVVRDNLCAWLISGISSSGKMQTNFQLQRPKPLKASEEMPDRFFAGSCSDRHFRSRPTLRRAAQSEAIASSRDTYGLR